MLSDWDIYKRGAGTLVGIDPITPLHGPGSLRMGPGASGEYNVANLVSKGNAPYTPVGLLRGALAGLFTIDTSFTTDGGDYQKVGICCLQEGRNVSISGGLSASYVLAAERTVTSPAMRLTLRRYPDSLVPVEPAPLWTLEVIPPIALGTLFTLELEWEVSAEYSGIRFQVRRGQATNYSDLVTLADVIHPVGTLPTTSLGEGPCMIGDLTTQQNFACHVDQWRLRA